MITAYNTGQIILLGGEVKFFPLTYTYYDEDDRAEYVCVSSPDYDIYYKKDELGLITRRIAGIVRVEDLVNKQDKLTAGANIAITKSGDKTIISATGSGSGWVNQEYVDTQDTAMIRAAQQYTDNRVSDKQDKLIAGPNVNIDEYNKITFTQKQFVTIISVDTETAEDETGTYEVTVPTVTSIRNKWSDI